MLIATWVLYTVFGILVFSLAFLWAVRARQFRDQDRARYLPLEGEQTADEPEETQRTPVSVIAMIVIFVACMVLVILTFILSYMRS